MNAQRLAAMDIGTNSIRCIVVEADHKGGYKVLDDEKSTVRLGEQLSRTGAISPQASARALAAVGHFRKLIAGLKVSAVEAIATSAMRWASNGQELLDALSAEFGHEIRVITGVEEAELAMASAQRHFDMEYKRYAVFDIGGGSLPSGIALWRLVDRLEPNITFNRTKSTIKALGVTWEPASLALHPGPQGEYASLRFTAPAAGVSAIPR